MSTSGKLKTLLDRGGNRTRDLWFASLIMAVPSELRVAVTVAVTITQLLQIPSHIRYSISILAKDPPHDYF